MQVSHPPHNLPPEEMPIGMLINEVSKYFHNRMRVEAEKLGIRDGFRQMLFFLKHHDGVTQLDLVNSSRLRPPTISVTLRRMEEEGLVTRETDSTDLRQVRVFITEKGRGFAETLIGCLKETEQTLVSSLDEAEAQTLRELLIKMKKSYYEPEQEK